MGMGMDSFILFYLFISSNSKNILNNNYTWRLCLNWWNVMEWSGMRLCSIVWISKNWMEWYGRWWNPFHPIPPCFSIFHSPQFGRYAMEWNHLILLLLFYPCFITSSLYWFSCFCSSVTLCTYFFLFSFYVCCLAISLIVFFNQFC